MSNERKDYERDLKQYIECSEKTQEQLEAWYNCYRSIVVDPEVVLTALDTIRAFNYFKK